MPILRIPLKTKQSFLSVKVAFTQIQLTGEALAKPNQILLRSVDLGVCNEIGDHHSITPLTFDKDARLYRRKRQDSYACPANVQLERAYSISKDKLQPCQVDR